MPVKHNAAGFIQYLDIAKFAAIRALINCGQKNYIGFTFSLFIANFVNIIFVDISAHKLYNYQ